MGKSDERKEQKMKRKGLLAGILLLILMLLCSCGASEEAKEIDAQLQEQQAGLAQAEAAYLEADGTIAPEHAQKWRPAGKRFADRRGACTVQLLSWGEKMKK